MKNLSFFCILLVLSFKLFAGLPNDKTPLGTPQNNQATNSEFHYQPDPGNNNGPIADVQIPKSKNTGSFTIISQNPATTYLDIQLSLGNNQKADLGLYDLTGKLVKSIAILPVSEKQIRITRDNLPAGIYFLVLKTETEQFCRKVVFS